MSLVNSKPLLVALREFGQILDRLLRVPLARLSANKNLPSLEEILII